MLIPSKNEKVGVAVIGCGYWGANYVRILHELTGSRVSAICDQRPERLQEMQAKYPDTAMTTDVSDAVNRDDVDAVVICTEATSHYAISRQALMAGKHVLVEKPIATTVFEAEDLVTVARKMGVTLLVGHTFLYNPAIRKVKEYIQQGDLGRLFYLNARRTNLGPVRRDVNALWDLAPHDVSIFNYWLDATPSWVSAVGAKVLRNGREDVGFISLGYEGGIVGHIHVSWADPQKTREMVVVGSDKRIVFNDLKAPEQIWLFENGVSAMEAAMAKGGQVQIPDSGHISPKIEESAPLTNQCEHFIDCIQQRSTPLTGGRQGLDVVRVLDAVDRSIERNGAPIELESVDISVADQSAISRSSYAAP